MLDPELVARFTTPGKEYGPTPLWWWSGGRVTREGIRWQLERFAAGGIHNLVVINLAPKGPTYGSPPDDPGWFSEEWWTLFAYACEVAAELDTKLWFYDQIGFSGANIQGQITAKAPDAAGRNLRSRTATVGEGGALALEPRENLIGVYGSRIGRQGWESIGWAHGVSAAPEGTDVRVVAWTERAFDYLDPNAVALLLDYIHGEFERRVPEHLGSVIAGSFQDELPAMPTWSSTFLDGFRRIAGYDLAPHLPSLWSFDDDLDARVRSDYYRVRSELAQQAFFRPLADWHARFGMLLGADQFNPARGGFPTQGTQLYADYIATHRWYNAVGSDHEGDARFHSSIADLYDHPRVWIESFHSSGWGGTLEDTWDWLMPFFRSGANLYNPHASYYSTHAGWFEWAPPSTDFRQPYYAVYPEFSTAVARVCSVLTWGRHQVDVGLLHPTTTIQAQLPPDLPVDHFGAGQLGEPFHAVDETQRIYLELAGQNNWFQSAPGLLDRLGLDFDVVDEDSIGGAHVEGASLAVNGFAFRTIILPAADYLHTATAERLEEFVEGGGRLIVVGRRPRWAAGLTGADEAVARLAAHPGLVVVDDAEGVGSALEGVAPFAWAAEAVRAQRQGDTGVAFVPAAFPNASAFPLRPPFQGVGWTDYDFDPRRYAPSTELRLDATLAEAEVWNPATGERRPLRLRVADGVTTATIDFQGAPAVLVAWREGTPARQDAVTAAPSAPTIESLESGWLSELVPTLDNTWGDFALPAGAEVPLELWKLSWRDGDRESRPARATFGQEVLIGGPWPESAAPATLEPAEIAAILRGGDLGDEQWSIWTYSLSRGVEKDPDTPLGNKGFVPDEFVQQRRANAGEASGARAIIRVDAPGDYDLTLAATSAKRLWFNGVEIPVDDRAYRVTVPVTLTSREAVLEYRLGPDEAPPGHFPTVDIHSLFTLERRGAPVPFPEFLAPGAAGVSDGLARYRRSFTLAADVVRASVVTGAACALTLTLDGDVIARQEKVEYYESAWGGNPNFFTHQIGAIAAGGHQLEFTAFSADPNTAIYVDLLLEYDDGRREVIVSDSTWTVGLGSTAVELVRGRGRNLTAARAALRPHPLADAHWLVGNPEIGERTVRFETAVSSRERPQRYFVLLPAGTFEIGVPAPITQARVEGAPIVVAEGSLRLDAPLQHPALLQLETAATAYSIGGAAFTGPITVRTKPSPGRFGDWRELGLGAWSGGVRWTRSIEVRAKEQLTLDLGRVKGAVRVTVDGATVGSAFCLPYAVELGPLSPGPHEIGVTLYSTLATRLDSSSPTTWVFESQLEVGVFGPVTLRREGEPNWLAIAD